MFTCKIDLCVWKKLKESKVFLRLRLNSDRIQQWPSYIWKKLNVSRVLLRSNKWLTLSVPQLFTFFKPSSLWQHNIMTISLYNNTDIWNGSFVYEYELYLRLLIGRGWGCCFCHQHTSPTPFLQTIVTGLCLTICLSAFRYNDHPRYIDYRPLRF